MKFLQGIAQECLKSKPEIWEEPNFCEYGKRAIFYSGLDGRRNFAWIGLPAGASPEKKVPGIVLVHGGGGTAFPNWVDYWNKLGFAAISMDNCGGGPDIRREHNNHPRHSYSGPAGWGAFGEQLAWKVRDRWFPHAVGAVLNAASVLEELPEVDADRIGITGVSWGGVLTCIAAGLDSRFRAVCPVYGCGFRTESAAWQAEFDRMSAEELMWWRDEWDPANYLPKVKAPVLWFNGTNDGHFFPPEWQKSASLVPAPVDYCMKIRWPHAHGPAGEEPREIAAFFREHLAGGPVRTRLGKVLLDGGRITASVAGASIAAQLCVTTDSGAWPEREWVTLPARREDHHITAQLPPDWQAAYLMTLSGELLTSTSPLIFR